MESSPGTELLLANYLLLQIETFLQIKWTKQMFLQDSKFSLCNLIGFVNICF